MKPEESTECQQTLFSWWVMGGWGSGHKTNPLYSGVCNGQKLQLSYVSNTLSLFPYCCLAIYNAVRKFFTFGSRRACVLDCIQNISQSEILSPHCLTSLIGASLSEPHTSGTACGSVFVTYLFACSHIP